MMWQQNFFNSIHVCFQKASKHSLVNITFVRKNIEEFLDKIEVQLRQFFLLTVYQCGSGKLFYDVSAEFVCLIKGLGKEYECERR